MRIPIYALLCIAFIGVEYGCKASASAIGQRSSRVQGRDRDSLSVVRYLAQIKCSARMIVKGDRGRFAIVTQDSHTCKPSVLVLTVTRDAVSRVENMRNVDCCYPRSVTWVGLRGVRGHALVIRFDDPVEGELGMYLYGDTGQAGRLSKIYQDGAGACAPAELRTVDGDLALVSYQENPSGEDCESLCHIVIGRRFGMPPSWLQLEVWDGRRWTAAPSHLHVWCHGYLGEGRLCRRPVSKWLLADEPGSLSKVGGAKRLARQCFVTEQPVLHAPPCRARGTVVGVNAG